MSSYSEYGSVVTSAVNRSFGNREPWQIASITTATVLGALWMWNFVNQDESVYSRSKRRFFTLLKKVPLVRAKIDAEIEKINADFVKDIRKGCEGLDYVYELPATGLSKQEIMERVDNHLQLGKYTWRDGRVSGAVYYYDPELIQMVTEVYGKASYTNPLHSDIFPGVCKMEAEVVRMALNLFHGGDRAAGCMTTGGTESILMACKAFRDYARDVKGITRPNIVVPTTVHAAFDKAGQYFGIHVKSVPVNADTTEVDIAAMKRAINRNTILLVGSAPNFPYGTMDDIEAISELGVQYNIPVHVDACLGGFLVAFMKQAGYNLRPFDFSLPGVCSISADTHKYGFAPKGSSIIMYTDRKYRDYQYTVTTDWPGGVYGSPSVNGSRAGGIIAACWATLMSFGQEGYVEATKKIVDTARYIERKLRGVEGIYIFGTPATSVIAFGSKTFDIFRLSDALCKEGWNLNALQFPSGIHMCVTHMHTAEGVADEFIADVIKCVEVIMKEPGKPLEGKMAVYGVAQSIPDRSLIGDFTKCFLDSLTYTPPKPISS